jgi:hypothetical protein
MYVRQKYLALSPSCQHARHFTHIHLKQYLCTENVLIMVELEGGYKSRAEVGGVVGGADKGEGGVGIEAA